MSTRITTLTESATVEISIPNKMEVHDYRIELYSSRPKVDIEVCIEIPNVEISLPDGSKIIIPKLRLCYLQGEMVPVRREGEIEEEWFHTERPVDTPVIKEDETHTKRRHIL